MKLDSEVNDKSMKDKLRDLNYDLIKKSEEIMDKIYLIDEKVKSIEEQIDSES